MVKTIAAWLEERTGIVGSARSLLETPAPGGPRLGRALGLMLFAMLVVELVTGLLLMTVYSPSTGTAWGSVYFLSYQLDHGWMIRGFHRFGAYASVILGAMFLLRVVFVGAYRAPREVQWWLAVGLFLTILVLGVSGNILPWDQRGYWAAVVETTIAGGVPVVGETTKKLILGGSELGNLALTRIYAVHVFVLPAIVAGILHVMFRLFLKNGFVGPKDSPRTEPTWPGQAFWLSLGVFVALGVVVGLTIAYRGYSLDAPADPASEDFPARPEWYFLALYQLLKEFQGQEVLATVVLPGAVVTSLMALPFLDKVLPRKFAHVLACLLIVGVFGGAGFFTYKAWMKDAHSEDFARARAKADAIAERALFLAGREGVPPEGSSYLLKRDPLHRGGEIFRGKCVACHNLGEIRALETAGADLKAYGSLAWIRGLLEAPGSEAYFGKVPQCDGMTTWKESSKLSAKELDDVAGYVASFAKTSPDATPAEWLAEPANRDHPGRAIFQAECVDCHTFGDPAGREKKTQPAPDLFAWGSDRWTARMIREPGSTVHYGYLETEQKMPAYATQFTDDDIHTLVRFLKGDYEPQPSGDRASTKPR